MIARRSSKVSGRRLVAGAFRFGSSRNSTFRRAAAKSDKLSRAHCQLSSRGAVATFEVSAFEVVIGFKPYDNYLPAWRHRHKPEEAEEMP
jgi:hypothetical protein